MLKEYLHLEERRATVCMVVFITTCIQDTLRTTQEAVKAYKTEFEKQILPTPPRVKIHNPHEDFNVGTTYHIDYFPFCHETYFNWLLCHASHIHRDTMAQLDQITTHHTVCPVKFYVCSLYFN